MYDMTIPMWALSAMLLVSVAQTVRLSLQTRRATGDDGNLFTRLATWALLGVASGIAIVLLQGVPSTAVAVAGLLVVLSLGAAGLFAMRQSGKHLVPSGA